MKESAFRTSLTERIYVDGSDRLGLDALILRTYSVASPRRAREKRSSTRFFSPFFQRRKSKVEPKTVQGILRHAKIQTTLDLYAQDDGDETRAAQGDYLTALGVDTQMVQ